MTTVDDTERDVVARATAATATLAASPSARRRAARTAASASAGAPDLSYVQALPVAMSRYERLELTLVGCGGTGSWLVPHLARLVAELRRRRPEIEVTLTLIDPDIVEDANVPRQNFCAAEISRPGQPIYKARTLALRYGGAWGVEMGAVIEPFTTDLFVRLGLGARWGNLSILIGCVDNAAARRELATCLAQVNPDRRGLPPALWWLDCGNQNYSGQVLFGNAVDRTRLGWALDTPGSMTWLPAPALQDPDLLTPLPEELTDQSLSCADLLAANAQGMNINARLAVEASEYLTQLLVAGPLKRFATWVSLRTGASHSQYTDPEVVARAVGRSPQKLFGKALTASSGAQTGGAG